MQTKDNPNYIFTRPGWAIDLIQAGANVEKVPNPWNPEKLAWRVELTPQSAKIVIDLCTKAGKTIPSIVQKVAEMEADADA